MFKNTALALSLAMGTAAMTFSMPVSAQSRGATLSVDVSRVGQGSTAGQTALAQIQTTYAANIQQARQLEDGTAAQIQPLVASGQAEQAKAQPNQGQLQSLRTQIDQIRGSAQAQVQQLIQPAQIAQAYVTDQLNQAIQTAIQTVGRQRNAGAVVTSEAAIYVDPANDITAQVIAELNRSTPQVGIIAPPEWLQARGVGAPSGQPAQAVPTPQPQGR